VLIGATASVIQRLLGQGKVTCQQLVKFYTKRTLKYGITLNLVTEFLYERAMKMAEEKDTILAPLVQKWKGMSEDAIGQNMRELGLLFGVPMSLKDCFELKGTDSTLGAAVNCFKPDEEDGLIPQMLINAGAIPFVKSNIPQLLLINETNNYIWGPAKNPWDTKRTCGGSSGGEAGLISLGCSPLGIGSDGGGSVRIPALYCGLYGFRPTGKRFTFIGHKMPSAYVPRHIYGCVGPLTKNMDDCNRILQVMQKKEDLETKDMMKCPQQWNESELTVENGKKLKIGYMRRLNVRIYPH
jgi:Asp-tRNA(Asn)/Glu-tRNA(Gln) amidotransferase A subunit family amidase